MVWDVGRFTSGIYSGARFTECSVERQTPARPVVQGPSIHNAITILFIDLSTALNQNESEHHKKKLLIVFDWGPQ